MNTANRVTAEHLRRQAYLYVRQSTFWQVQHNRESTAQQYDLEGRAQALGWRAEQIVVIDEDQGHSAATTANRSGFRRLAADVGLGRVGLVMGLEVSRLARSSSVGTACWRSARSPIPSSWIKTGFMIPATSTIGWSLG